MAWIWDFIIVLIILFGIVYLYCHTFFNYWKIREVQHRKPTVLFGNLLDIILGNDPPGKYIAKLYNDFDGPYFGFFVFTKPFFVLKDPDLIKRVLIKDFHIFPNRHFFSDEKVDSILSNSLFAIKTPYWRALRTKLSPVFTSGKMKMMFNLILECGENLKDYIETVIDKNIEMKEIAGKYTTDVIASCAFGINANSFINENHEFLTFSKGLFLDLPLLCYFFAPSLVKLLKFKSVDDNSVNFFIKVFSETIKYREETKIKRNDLIDILIDLKNEEIADDEFKFHGNRLVTQAIIFFFAGQETTSSSISFTLYELCGNNDIQTRLREEINEVIDKHGVLTYEALQNMRYLDMVVSETLRKYPLTPFIHRECSEDYKIPETGLIVEKGTPVLIPQHGLHWDSKYFPNPDKYDPERFNDENKKDLIHYVYLPFGEGPRNCIGERFALMSTKLGIINIIRNFKVEKNSKTEEHLKFKITHLLKPKNGIQLTCRRL